MKSLILAALLALPLPAFAETREERVAAAKEYVDLALQGFDMSAMIDTMYQPILQQVAAGGATLTTTRWRRSGSYLPRHLHRTDDEAVARPVRDHGGHVHFGRDHRAARFLRDARGQVGDGETAAADGAQQPGMVALINEKMEA